MAVGYISRQYIRTKRRAGTFSSELLTILNMSGTESLRVFVGHQGYLLRDLNRLELS